MSADPTSRAADMAARQVEAIVNAAQKAADAIRAEAERDASNIRRDAEREAKRVREEAKDDGEAAVEKARKQAIEIEEEARDAAAERIEGAEQAATEALGDARAVSDGMRRLGAVLGDQADRMLRDVQAAHKRLMADLRVAGVRTEPRALAAASSEPAGGPLKDDEAAKLTELAERERERARKRPGDGEPPRRRTRAAERANPFEDIDVPSWVEPEP